MSGSAFLVFQGRVRNLILSKNLSTIIFKLTLEPTEATVVTSDWLVGGTSAVERVGVGLASVVVGFGEVLSGLKPGGKRDPATSSKSNFSNSCGVKIANGLIAITKILLVIISGVSLIVMSIE